MPDRKNDISSDDLGGKAREVFDVLAAAIGHDAALAATIALVQYYGGGQIYLHKLDTLAIPARNRQMALDFDGANYRDIAKRHNLSESRVREVLRHKKD